MKKYFLSIVALAAMLFATSCQESLVEPQMDGTTTFTIEVPAQMGTKAVGETYNLYVEVYKDNGTDLLHRIDDLPIKSGEGESTTVSLNLVATQEYDIIFWAQKAEAYGVEPLTNVDMDIKNHHNSEGGAAYYAILNNFKPILNNTPSVVLRRPFAQLNIGTLLNVSYSNDPVTINTAKVTVSEVASEFNRVDMDGTEGVGQNGVVYTTGNESPYSGTVSTIEVGGNDYAYVSMDYLAVVNNKALVDVTVELNVTDPYDVPSVIKRTITNVPLQMNYRTNIVGNLITSEAGFTVTIDESWDGTNNKEVKFREVATAEELQNAIEEGVDNITLTADIDLTETLEFRPVQGPNPIARTSTNETSFVLDLGGNIITAPEKEEGRHYYAIDNYANLTIVGEGAINARGIQNFGTMTIDGNITITNIDTNGGAAIWNEGNITINGGTFTTNDQAGAGSYGAALNTRPGGKAIVNGGTFIANSQLTYAIINEGETIIHSAIVKGRHGAVASVKSNDKTQIYGGSFELMDNPDVSDHCTYYVSSIYGGQFTLGNNTDSGAQVFYESEIAEGYRVSTKDGWHIVEPITVKVSTADELVAALENNQNVIFANDIKIEPANMSNAYGKTGINVKNGQTIDGNGHTLNIKGAGGTWDSGINTTGGLIKNITVTGSFRGIFINHTSEHSEKVVLENVTIGGNGTVYTISCDQGLYQGIEATNCTFNGWTSFAKTAGEAKFVNCNFGEGSGYKYCRPYSNTEFVSCTFCPGYAVDQTRATVTFTDCTFEE